MMKPTVLLAALALVAPAFAATGPNKPAILDNWDKITPGMQAIPSQPYRKNLWTDSIPEDCVKRAQQNHNDQNYPHPRCAVNNMNIFEIFYNDSPSSWIFCVCRDITYKEDALIHQIGRLPVAIRQKVRHIHGFKFVDYTNSPAAWMDSLGDMAVFLDAGTNMYFHETGHAIDKNGALSTSAEFKDAVAKDPRVATPYAQKNLYEKNNYGEAWAEIFILRRYEVQIGPLLVPFGNNFKPSLDMIANQLRVVAKHTDALLNVGYQASAHLKPGKILKRSQLQTRDMEGRSEEEGETPVIISSYPASLYSKRSAIEERDSEVRDEGKEEEAVIVSSYPAYLY